MEVLPFKQIHVHVQQLDLVLELLLLFWTSCYPLGVKWLVSKYLFKVNDKATKTESMTTALVSLLVI